MEINEIPDNGASSAPLETASESPARSSCVSEDPRGPHARRMVKPEPTHIQGICIICKKNKQTRRADKKYTAYCNSCSKKRWQVASTKRQKKRWRDRRLRPYTAIYDKKDRCDKCGFVAAHPCQLDIDHIDGDKANMAQDNFQTLCANCHRLKTQQNKDWEKSPVQTD